MQERRRTMSWQDFASDQGGFLATNEALSQSLSFSPPVQEQIQHWPEEREELRKKLKKAHKESLPFTWDTTPTLSGAKGPLVEEMFLDVWVDLLHGGGWSDREELTFRPSNWVLMEYKLQTPATSDQSQEEGVIFLFEEVVPPEYQQGLARPKQKKVGGFFSRTKSFNKQKHSQGISPPRLSRDEAEFDSHLRKQTPTKQLTLSKSLKHHHHHPATPLVMSTNSSAHSTLPSAPAALRRKLSPRSGLDAETSSKETRKPVSAVPASTSGGGLLGMRNLFHHKTTLENQRQQQPPLMDTDEASLLETRTLSGISTSGSTFFAGASDPSVPKPKGGEGDKWVGKLIRVQV